ncbi:transglutaminase domain-containing protein [Lactovum miscens]|uniref:Transglutaminase/protease-like cytokinesis protein 3 n=1 Tax=Lactovum miscens TaxID=190387 RepID=A0A841C9F2_9LACT|nr:transglutaminase domain-containing protein [Lactovum miscens]MBB5888191.1 transglutaminase/protease-like cytokinesis protein 3 [Lactovum miscens]
MIKHSIGGFSLILLTSLLCFPMISKAQTINQRNHDFDKVVKDGSHFFKKAPRFKLKLINSQINSNYQPRSLDANQEQLIMKSSPNTISETQLFNLTDKELAVNYDWYDYNILHAFQVHSVLPIEKGFSAIKLENNQGEYVQAQYSKSQIQTVYNIMYDFSVALKGKNSKSQKADAIVQLIDDRLQYSTDDSNEAQKSGDLYSRGLAIGVLQSYVSVPQDDYGAGLEAYNIGGGVCQEYTELTQLGFLYAGLQSVVVDNITPELYAASSAGEANYLHTWNELNLGGSWYGADSTWTDTGQKGGYDSNWEVFSENQSLLNDFYISLPAYGIDNYPQHTAIANAQTLRN